MTYLAAAFVPTALGEQWARGELSDLQLFTHPDTGKGTCLYVAELDGKMAWRALAQICRTVRPAAITFRTRVPSILTRSRAFGALPRHYDAGENDGPCGRRFWADGRALERFLESLGLPATVAA